MELDTGYSQPYWKLTFLCLYENRQNVLLLEIVYVAEKTMQELFMAGNEQIH